MKEYILFLDESKPNDQNPLFCLGGCIIEKCLYETQIINYIKQLKLEIFKNTDVILHETDIRMAKNGPYKIMRNVDVRNLFWDSMRKLFEDYEIVTIGVVIEPSKCKTIYNSINLNDEYFMALQIILENYTYYLECKKAKGSIFVESRNPTEDQRLQNHYFKLMNSGTLFLRNSALQSHLTTISFPMKVDNNIGLQIADFIPNTFKKYNAGHPQKKPNIADKIVAKLYDGDCNEMQRFGLKKIL